MARDKSKTSTTEAGLTAKLKKSVIAEGKTSTTEAGISLPGTLGREGGQTSTTEAGLG